jgi:hypothetical protein
MIRKFEFSQLPTLYERRSRERRTHTSFARHKKLRTPSAGPKKHRRKSRERVERNRRGCGQKRGRRGAQTEEKVKQVENRRKTKERTRKDRAKTEKKP